MTTTVSPSINDQVRIVFTHHPHLKSERVHITTNKGRVTLKGQVKTFFEKQMAQEAVRGIDGVDQVDNELEVDW